MITKALQGAILAGIWIIVRTTGLCAAILDCPAFPPSKIEIEVEQPNDSINTTKSLDEMRAAAPMRHPAPIVGAYVGALEYGIQIDDTVREIKTGRFCGTPKYVTLKVTLARIIYIPREFAGDPCLASLARDHEGKHAESDVKALKIARPSFELAVHTAVSRATKEAAASRSEALAALATAIQSSVSGAFDEMAVVRKRLDAEADNPAELGRLKTACGGRAAQQTRGEPISW